jgi:dienelactone hydrolase
MNRLPALRSYFFYQMIFAILLMLVISLAQDTVKLRTGNYFTPEQGKQELENFSKLYSNKAEWVAIADTIKRDFLIGADLYPLPKKTPLKPIIHSRRILDGYWVENVAFESLPGFFVTGNLYGPTKKYESYAAILCPHGHFPPHPGYPGGRFRREMQIRCACLARMGAYVFAYDMIGWGESTQFKNYNFPKSHDTFKKELEYQLWNSIRSLDFMLTLKDVDPVRTGITGASGGGTQTFDLAAVDPRVAVSVPVVQVSSFFFGGCVGESGMPVHQTGPYKTDNAIIAALFAPKPQLIISDTSDWTRYNPEIEIPYIKSVYKLFGAENKIENVHLKERHGYGVSKRFAAYKFLAENLNLDLSAICNKYEDRTIDESFVTIEPQDSLLVFTKQYPRPSYAIKDIATFKWKQR